MNDTIITIVGNLTADPELRFTAQGAAVAGFTIASTPRVFDKASGQWKDGDALFLRCSLWRDQAENAAESLTRGTRVIATGRLKQRSFETKQGEQRSVIELEVEEIAVSLRYSTAKPVKAARSGGGGFSSKPRQEKPKEAVEDPWGSSPEVGGGFTDTEPPF